MHGYAHEDLIGLNRADLLEPGSRERWLAAVQALRNGRDSRIQLIHRRHDGSQFYADIQGSSILYQGHQAVLLIIRDVTQELEAQEELERRVAERTRELSLLLDITRGVTSTLDLKPLLELILDHLKTIVDYAGTAIMTRKGDALVIAGQQGPLPDEVARQLRYPIARLAPVWDRLSRGEAIIIPDVRGESAEARVFRDLVGADLDTQLGFIGSCLWVPLVVKDQLIGLMSITRQETDAFSPDRIDLATAIARQAAVAIENARLFEQAQGKAALEERQRLARELHDSVSQALYGIGLGTRTARALLDRDPAKVAEPLEYVMSLAEAGMAEMRALIFELRPESLEQEGLVAALEKQAAAMRSRHALEVELALPPADPDISLAMKEALYRIAQEAMHNTAKHARATRITLRLDPAGEALVMEVIDNGLGFDSTAAFPGHLGLVSMQERAAPFGGRAMIDSAPGAGTRVHVSLPLRDGSHDSR
jgi:signal transduction histidine kinase